MDKLKEATSVSGSGGGDQPLSSTLQYQAANYKRKEEQLRQSDPKKAQQMDRLGMGATGYRR